MGRERIEVGFDKREDGLRQSKWVFFDELVPSSQPPPLALGTAVELVQDVTKKTGGRTQPVVKAGSRGVVVGFNAAWPVGPAVKFDQPGLDGTDAARALHWSAVRPTQLFPPFNLGQEVQLKIDIKVSVRCLQHTRTLLRPHAVTPRAPFLDCTRLRNASLPARDWVWRFGRTWV